MEPINVRPPKFGPGTDPECVVNRTATGWGSYSPDGSVEERDAAWIAKQGADYLKYDAVCGGDFGATSYPALHGAIPGPACHHTWPRMASYPAPHGARSGPAWRHTRPRMASYPAPHGTGAPPLNASYGILDWEQTVVSKMGMALNKTGRPIWYQYGNPYTWCGRSNTPLSYCQDFVREWLANGQCQADSPIVRNCSSQWT